MLTYTRTHMHICIQYQIIHFIYTTTGGTWAHLERRHRPVHQHSSSHALTVRRAFQAERRHHRPGGAQLRGSGLGGQQAQISHLE